MRSFQERRDCQVAQGFLEYSLSPGDIFTTVPGQGARCSLKSPSGLLIGPPSHYTTVAAWERRGWVRKVIPGTYEVMEVPSDEH